MKENAEPLVCKGTELQLSGHYGIVTAINKSGVEVLIGSKKFVFGFDKIMSILGQGKTVEE
jgi:hypothetical protein